MTYQLTQHVGCLTCRSLHAKCDERKPACSRCVERRIVCGGYSQPLRWVDQGRSRTKRRQPIDSIDLRTSSELSPFSPPRLRCTDAILLEHWLTVTVPQACLDPAASTRLRNMYLDMVYHPKRIALHAILAVSAAHMHSLGLTGEHDLVLARQRSLNSMIIELDSFTDDKNTAQSFNLPHSPEPHLPSPALGDASIMAAILLLGPEFINADHRQGPCRVRWLLQGARTLIMERHRYFGCHCPSIHPARSEAQFSLDSPVFISSVRSLAFTDIITCVPYARKPYIGKKYWLESALVDTREGLRNCRPDPDLGYSAWTLSLLGDCATLIKELYAHSISQQVFSMRQATLFGQLEDNAIELQRVDSERGDQSPAMAIPDSHAAMTAHKYNIAATVCHTISAQIFLLRSMDFDAKSNRVIRLRQALYESISTIPMEHSAATPMLWPLWVLGCESYPGTTCPSRCDITTLLQRLYKSQNMKNVEQCLDRLRCDIWREGCPESTDIRDKQLKPEDQSNWVKRCWEEKIELLLA